jgi:glutamine synthetase
VRGGGGNGLKNDAFVDYDFGGAGQFGGTIKDTIVTFSGAQLFFNETDGSSFPNGGLRQTHRAAAFMNWDRTSPIFVRNGTMFIPSAFVTHNGDALDEKTPLLRSQATLPLSSSSQHHIRPLYSLYWCFGLKTRFCCPDSSD